MGVNGVSLEPVGERALGELVENTALVNVEIVADLVVTPVGQVSRVVVDLSKLATWFSAEKP